LCLAIFKKILSINSALVAAGRKDISLNPSAQALFDSLRQSFEASKPVEDEDALTILVGICTTWDYADRLAPLDVLRCTAVSPLLASSQRVGNPIQVAISAATDGIPVGTQPNENSVMMAFRTIANLFSSPEGRNLLAQPEEAHRVITFTQRTLGLAGQTAIGKQNRNLLIASSTVVINYAVLISKDGKMPKEIALQLLEVAGHLLSTQKDSEVLYRSLVAAGTLITVLGKDAAQSAFTPVTRAKDAAIEPRVKEVADECLILLR
jgi:phospholipase A-2-activating protein